MNAHARQIVTNPVSTLAARRFNLLTPRVIATLASAQGRAMSAKDIHAIIDIGAREAVRNVLRLLDADGITVSALDPARLCGGRPIRVYRMAVTDIAGMAEGQTRSGLDLRATTFPGSSPGAGTKSQSGKQPAAG